MTEKALFKHEPPVALRPFAFFDDLRSDFEQLWQKPWLPMFTNRFRAYERGTEMTWTPRIDVLTKDGDLMVRADLPGMKKEDVKVTMEDGDLVLQGERKDASEVKEENFYRAECTYGAFYRRLPLAFKVDFAQVTAKFNDGVLEIRLPMPAKNEPKPTEIPVH